IEILHSEVKICKCGFVFICPAAISKLEEALLINPRKYDALWCWEMLKLLANYALRTRMRQRFQNVLYCFQKAFNEDGFNPGCPIEVSRLLPQKSQKSKSKKLCSAT
ncbi:hypothetical protein DVH24_010700, partial [Malus domestica]